ncbi:MAG: hydroxymethylbilane synthase [Alphaproteobacteria bacterium]|nr:MAG: hydroxymethylbilane synthase [Alphaproteobacteria bacterium]
MNKPLRIGTRGSPLALAQTELLATALTAKHAHLQVPGGIEIVTITTSGDRIQDRPLSEAGGKGLFTKEIEEALLAGDIDCAVHSMKDMPTVLPDGLCIPCLLPREDPRDAFFATTAKTLDDLPDGAIVGTSSLRRQAIVLARCPQLQVVTFRGNVGTRLKKLQEGVVDATLLAVAGLKRLKQEHLIRCILEPDVMLPAVAQGAVGIEIREDDAATRKLLEPVHCNVTELRVTAERAFLAVMDGSCRTPLAALMTEPDPQGRARFDALKAEPDGSRVHKVSYMMNVTNLHEAKKVGETAGAELLKKS